MNGSLSFFQHNVAHLEHFDAHTAAFMIFLVNRKIWRIVTVFHLQYFQRFLRLAQVFTAERNGAVNAAYHPRLIFVEYLLTCSVDVRSLEARCCTSCKPDFQAVDCFPTPLESVAQNLRSLPKKGKSKDLVLRHHVHVDLVLWRSRARPPQ